MTVLVTGATGTNGLEVAKQTLDLGGRVRAFVRDGRSARAVLPPEADLFEGDFSEPASARAAMQGGPRITSLESSSVRSSLTIDAGIFCLSDAV
jgi:uncharacterized protein YbjT (DUF2867 family)